MAGLQFAPWLSDIELSFYAALASRKINHDKLDESARKVVGTYEMQPSDAPERSTRVQIHGNAFEVDEIPLNHYRAEGTLKNTNTIEEYTALDKTKIMESAGHIIWDAIIDGTIYSCPSLLSSFYVIFFADLKKYRFTYHFAFPALHSDPPWKSMNQPSEEPVRLRPDESTLLFDAVKTWKHSVDQAQHGFFLARRKGSTLLSEDRRESSSKGKDQPQETQEPLMHQYERQLDTGTQWEIDSLAGFENGFFTNAAREDQFVCFADPSTYPHNPGWMLRNLLVLVQQRWKLDEVQILCFRDTHIRPDQTRSIVLNLRCATETRPSEDSKNMSPSPMPKVTGWERNDSNKLGSRTVDLGEYMDPRRLADQSVDLNLKLMKWRIAPDLDLDTIKSAKCLLLGAGTLGSYVSRNLLGWGVRKITFIDNAKVSFSNPVRQPLFNFKDCLEGGTHKALRAAEVLQEIYPGVDATGHVLSVPMAGHPITDEAKVKEDFELLRALIEEHDVIFLLMDTRESRWLPTVIGKAAGKIVMNAALGFDTYVVMRHGATTADSERAASLGCYFCNDVVAPKDSVSDRTLDQQCTVTRPGVAAIASALLVELLVSILQHPRRAHAPAPPSRSSPRDPEAHPLGLVPHQIRGYLASFDNLLISGPAYDCCSACSWKVVGAYERDGWEFVKRCLNEAGYVEELSGLAEVQRRADEMEAQVGWSEEEEEVGEIGAEDGELV